MKLNSGDLFLHKQMIKPVMGLSSNHFDYYYRVLFKFNNLFFYQSWDFDNPKFIDSKKMFYYVGNENTLNASIFIGHKALSNEENDILHINDPIYFLKKIDNFVIKNEPIIDFEKFNEFTNLLNLSFENFENNYISKDIIVYCINNRGSIGNSLKINLNLVKTEKELLWMVYNLQSKFLKKSENFLFKGIRRLGHEKGIPCYVLDR